MAANTSTEIWNYGNLSIYKHSTGLRRFAVWDGGLNLCWCERKEDAERIAKSLVFVEINKKANSRWRG